MRKKLLYISNRVFWPPMGGHEVEMYGEDVCGFCEGSIHYLLSELHQD